MMLKKPKTTADHSDVWQQQLRDFHEIKGLSEWCRCADRSRLASYETAEQTEKTESDEAVYWTAFYIVVY